MQIQEYGTCSNCMQFRPTKTFCVAAGGRGEEAESGEQDHVRPPQIVIHPKLDKHNEFCVLKKLGSPTTEHGFSIKHIGVLAYI